MIGFTSSSVFSPTRKTGTDLESAATKDRARGGWVRTDVAGWRERKSINCGEERKSSPLAAARLERLVRAIRVNVVEGWN